MDVDLDGQLSSITSLPADVRNDYATLGRNNLFFLARYILGFKDMTVDCHGMMAAWYDQCLKLYKLLLCPRDCFKTSLFTITANIQRIIRNVNRTNLIVNESSVNASGMLSSIASHAENNPIFRALYSDIIPRDFRKTIWNADSLVFKRDSHVPEGTIDAMGMTSTIVSRHYNHITIDDPISEAATLSESVMRDAIHRMGGFLDLLVDPSVDTIDIPGTRWALKDTYSWAMEHFGTDLGILILPIVFPDGTLLFPERFPSEVIERKRRIMTPYRFSCTLMNNPRDEEIQDLNIKDLHWWNYTDANETKVELVSNSGIILDRWDLRQLDITTTVDPALSEKVATAKRQPDRNAIVTVGVSPKGQAIVLDVFAKRCKPTEVVDHLFYTQKRFNPRSIGIERAGYQYSLKYWVEQRALDEGTWLHIVPVKPPGGNKSHIRGLQPVMAVGRLFLNPKQHILINEMADYPLGEYDDTADCLALQLQLWNGVLSEDQRNRRRESLDKAVNLALRWGTKDAPRVERLPNGRLVALADDPEAQDSWDTPRFRNWFTETEQTQPQRAADRIARRRLR